MYSRVADDGLRSARLVLIGEAPGAKEMESGRPFWGPSGHKLRYWWRQVGLTREDFYITNVLDYMPKNIDRVPREEMEAAFAALHERLSLLDGPFVIVTTGNYALYACTGKGKVSWHKKDGRHERPGILDWRGSILKLAHGDGTYTKVIPTIHPAHILRTPNLERRALLDWYRIAEESKFPEVIETKRTAHIKPTIEEVEAFCAKLSEDKLPVSVDIETPKGRVTEVAVKIGEVTYDIPVIIRPTTKCMDCKHPHRDHNFTEGADGCMKIIRKKPCPCLVFSAARWKTKTRDLIVWERDVKRGDPRVVRHTSGKKKGEPKVRKKPGTPYIGCIGLGNTIDYAMCIPLTLKYWKDKHTLDRAEFAVAGVLRNPRVPLVMQNGMFDAAWLRREGYEVHGWVWDTRAMHHALDPRDDHDLAYMASIYTRIPFWKHEAKDPEEITKYATNSEALWTYNCIDVYATLEIFYILKERLEAEDLLAFYHQHYAAMMEPLLDMLLRGANMDAKRMRLERFTLDEKAEALAKVIESHAGMSLIAKKGLSNDRLKFLFYGAAGFPGEAGAKKFAALQERFPDVKPFNFRPLTKKGKAGEERSVTVDEIALRKLILKHTDKLEHLGLALLEHRRNRKMAEFVDTNILDLDGRLRCMYSFITEAGRLASQGTPWGTGRNLQNIDRELRYVFIPD